MDEITAFQLPGVERFMPRFSALILLVGVVPSLFVFSTGWHRGFATCARSGSSDLWIGDDAHLVAQSRTRAGDSLMGDLSQRANVPEPAAQHNFVSSSDCRAHARHEIK